MPRVLRLLASLAALASLIASATASSVFGLDSTASGVMLCGDNRVDVTLSTSASDGDVLQGELELRTDIKRVAFTVNATFDEDTWTIVGDSFTYLELGELCGCASDPGSDDCMAALAVDCGDNPLDVTAEACEACIDENGDADYAREGCAGNATALFAWFDDQDVCDDGYDKLCGCSDDYYDCPNIEYWCESGAVNDTSICDPCFSGAGAGYDTDDCGAAIEAVLDPMVTTQQCGYYAHPVCDCYVDGVLDATADACMLGASQTCVATDPYLFPVCLTCLNTTAGVPYYSEACQESLDTVVANMLVDQNCGAFTAPSSCTCEDDPLGYDCYLSMANVCFTDLATDYPLLCGNCTADFNSTDCRSHMEQDLMEPEGCLLPDVCICATEPTSIDCFEEFTALCTSDFASYATTCTECSISTSSDACTSSLGADLYGMGCQFTATAAGCDNAPDCTALNRAPCSGDDTCGACLDNYYGDAGDANSACEGVLDYCESLVFENGPWEGADNVIYDLSEDEPQVSGKPHFVQRIVNGSCDDEPWHMYYSTTYNIWALHSGGTVLEDPGLTAWVIWGANSPPALSWWSDAATSVRQEGLVISCETERQSRAVPLRHAQRMLDSVLTAEPSTFDSYVSVEFGELDEDTCSGFILAPPACDPGVPGDCHNQTSAPLHVTSISDRRVVAMSPDDAEFARVSEDSVNLLYPTGIEFHEPTRTMFVVDGEVKRYDMDTGDFIEVYQEEGRLDLASYVHLSNDGHHLYRAWEGNGDTQFFGEWVDIIDIDTFDETADTIVACVKTGAPGDNSVPTWVRDVTESLDGQHFYVLSSVYYNLLPLGYLFKCPTVAGGLLDQWNASNPEVCATYICEQITTGAGWNARGLEYHPDGSLLVADLDGTIMRWTTDGQLIGTFADGTTTGFGTDFSPYDIKLTPKQNGFYVTDQEYMAPVLFDLFGNLIQPVAEKPGFATSGGAMAIRPGMYAPFSTFTLSSSFVAGESIDIAISAVSATGEVWDGVAALVVRFTSLQEFAGEMVEITLDAEVEKTGVGFHEGAYSPLTSGSYVVSVVEGLFETQLSASPQVVEIVPAAVDGAVCHMDGDGLATHTVGETSSFVITYRDTYGNLCPSVPDDVELVIEVAGQVLEWTMAVEGATHVVEYTSAMSGQHLITGYVDGVAIGSSPYVVYLQPDDVHADNIVVSSEATPDTDSMMVSYAVTITCFDQFGNQLADGGLLEADSSLAAVSVSASADCDALTDQGDGTYTMTCITPAEESPSFTVEVTLGGVEVADSPHALQYRVVVETAGMALFGLFTALAALSIVGTVVVLLLTYFNRREKIMNASSPPFLYLILLGCILVFIVAILYGIDSEVTDDADTRQALCRSRPFFIGVGFQLVFGALLAKTWRIAKIFGNKGLKKVVCKTSTLYKLVLGCVCFELVYLSLWLALDPMMLVTRVKSESAAEIRVFELCESDGQGTWLLIGYLSKAIMLLYGAVLAYRVRGVQSRFNESKWIALCIYNMMIMGMIFVPVSHLVWDSMSASFIIASAGSTLSTLVVIGLLFGQKFMIIFLYKGVDYEAQAAGNTVATQGNAGGATSGRGSKATTQVGVHTDSDKLMTLTMENTQLKAKLRQLTMRTGASRENSPTNSTSNAAGSFFNAPTKLEKNNSQSSVRTNSVTGGRMSATTAGRTSVTSGKVQFDEEEEAMIQNLEVSAGRNSGKVAPSG